MYNEYVMGDVNFVEDMELREWEYYLLYEEDIEDVEDDYTGA
jgi:hypothetical protein